MAIGAGSTRRPTAKERQKLEGRLRRLDRAAQLRHIAEIYEKMPRRYAAEKLVIRSGFSFRDDVPFTDASDRSAPPPEQRPSATRLVTSRGSALRFALTVLAVIQANRKVGTKARLSELQLPVAGRFQVTGWSDLVAADSVDSRGVNNLLAAGDKRARGVRNALDTLEAAGVVDIGLPVGSRGRYENFEMLNEVGRDVLGNTEPYTVPRSGEATFSLPAGFVRNGWLHVLEDSEIAIVLMIACGKSALRDGRFLAFEGQVRLRNYGIHRDSFSAARKTLEWFGLLEVHEVERHHDGRAERAETRLHRLRLRLDGFDDPGPDTVLDALRSQVGRG